MLILAIVLIGVMELNDQPDRSRLTSLNGNSAETLPALNVSYGSAVYSRVSAGSLVFISSLSSTLTTILLSITMILVSFSVAYNLSRHSDSTNEEQLPPPYQLSLLIGMLHGKLPSLWSFWRYRLGSKKKRVKITQDLWKAMAWLGGVALLALLITLVDAWFHNTVTTVQYLQTIPASTADHMIDSFAPGRGLPTRCLCGGDIAACIDSCRSYNDTAGARGIPSLQNATEYGKFLAGKSQINMIYSNQHGSIILPAAPPSESQFDALTFGSSTSCMMATEMCQPHKNDAKASESGIIFSCNISAAGLDLNGSFDQIVQPPGIGQFTEANFSVFDNSLFELSPLPHGFGIQWYDDSVRSHRSIDPGRPSNLSGSQLWRGLVFEVETDLFPSSQDLANLSEILEDTVIPTTLGVVPVPAELVGGILACTTTISEVVYNLLFSPFPISSELLTPYQHYQMISGSVVSDTWASMNDTAPFLFVDVSTTGFGKAQLQQGIRLLVVTDMHHNAVNALPTVATHRPEHLELRTRTEIGKS